MSSNNNTNPIGVFDSGIGGLTVVKKIESFLPKENLVYFGDTARVPYGSKSNSTVIEYALQDANLLVKKNVKMIIVACNTASSVALPELNNHFNIPIIGMIEPGSNLAISKTQNGKIGVIGTYATINNKAYSKELLRQNPELEVFEKACPLFVPLAEEGLVDHKATELIAEDYLQEFIEKGIDTLILGCTHYPILFNIIQKVMGEKVTLIDSGTAASIVVEKYLSAQNIKNSNPKNGTHDFYVSDLPTKFKEVADRFLGKELEHIHKIDLEDLV